MKKVICAGDECTTGNDTYSMAQLAEPHVAHHLGQLMPSGTTMGGSITVLSSDRQALCGLGPAKDSLLMSVCCALLGSKIIVNQRSTLPCVLEQLAYSVSLSTN